MENGVPPGRAVAAVTALAAAALACWLLAPVMDLVFSDGSRDALRWAPDGWLPFYGRAYEALGRDLGLSAYYFWGRFTVLVYAAGLFGASTFPRGRTRMSRVGRRLLILGFGLGLVGNVGAYWGATGRPPSGRQPAMSRQPLPDLENSNAFVAVGFLVESLAGLLVLVALAVLAVALLRDRRHPVWVAWVLLTGALVTIPLTVLGIDYVPHGYLLPILVTMAVALAGLARATPGSLAR